MKMLRFIAPESQYRILHPWLLKESPAWEGGKEPTSPKKFRLEGFSLFVIRDICKENGVEFEFVSSAEFLAKPDKSGISLLLEGELEPLFYNDNTNFKFYIDGQNVSKIVGDKYTVYNAVSSLEKIKQPQAVVIRNHKDLSNALDAIKTELVVIKPRTGSYESRNIFIVNRQRLQNIQSEELINFSNCVMQEYLEDTLYPPTEVRFHFVGRKLCRALKIVDKNNWSKSFQIENFSLDNLPKGLTEDAKSIISVLVPEKSRDNVTIDFLLARSGAFFLEANCGCVNSFFVDTKEEKPYLEPIFRELFKVYF